MGIWERLTSYFGGSRAAASAGTSASTTPPELSRLARGFVLGSRDQAAMLRAFSDFPHLHTVVRSRAEAIGSVGWRLYRVKGGRRGRGFDAARARGADHQRLTAELVKKGELEEILDHDLLDVLRRPAARMSGPAFWELASEYEDLVGEVVWLKSRVGKRVVGLLPIVPTWLVRQPDLHADYFDINAPSGRIKAPARDVIWLRQFDPVDPYNNRGVGTAMVLRDELLTDELMSQMARGRFANRGYPDLLIGLLGHPNAPGPKPGQPEVDRFTVQMEQKHQGVHKVGQAHVVAGDYKAQLLGHTLVETQYMEARRFNRDTTMQTFREPPELCGVLDNANRSTIDVAEDLEARRGTRPKLDRFRSALQDELVGDFGDDLVLGYHSPVPADRDLESGYVKALPAAFRINEIRARANEAPIAGPEGEEFYKAPGAVPVAGSPSSPPESEKKKKEST